ncbi:hypothetical protein BSKO_04738 [Bryopsis sp. KO-2023]|nr:hypothetical protein BSKO_04738 [Bryopsis sp. KO-2023]
MGVLGIKKWRKRKDLPKGPSLAGATGENSVRNAVVRSNQSNPVSEELGESIEGAKDAGRATSITETKSEKVPQPRAPLGATRLSLAGALNGPSGPEETETTQDSAKPNPIHWEAPCAVEQQILTQARGLVMVAALREPFSELDISKMLQVYETTIGSLMLVGPIMGGKTFLCRALQKAMIEVARMGQYDKECFEDTKSGEKWMNGPVDASRMENMNMVPKMLCLESGEINQLPVCFQAGSTNQGSTVIQLVPSYGTELVPSYGTAGSNREKWLQNQARNHF